MAKGRYRLVELLRSQGVPDRHIRRTLQTELGLTVEEADDALQSAPATR